MTHGNRTVTHHWVCVFDFSPFSKGEMLSFFSFRVFRVWFGVFCRFFAVGFSGCHSGPRASLGFSLNLLRPFSWDARRQGFSWASLAWFSFSPCVLFCGHTFSRRTGGGLTNPAGSLTHLGGVTPRGRPNLGRGLWTPPFLGNLTAYFVCQRVAGTFGRMASGTFSVGGGGGASICPPRSHFSHALLFCSRPRFFFSLRPLGPRLAMDSETLCKLAQTRVAEWNLYSENGKPNSESCSENSPAISESYLELIPRNS